MPDVELDLPFQPIRKALYSSEELMSGFDPDDPDSMTQTLDFKTYRYYMQMGAAVQMDPYASMMEALHDNSMLRATTAFLKSEKKPTVAIMGGHNEQRDKPNFRSVVQIARRLTQEGCLVASGGGPGAMEATHLGALLASASDEDLDTAIASLQAQPALPESRSVVAPDGGVNMDIARQLHAWAKPAWELSRAFNSKSLAIPTWYYGHEPISPLATHVAKFFQNSIREDVLLAIAANGIIFAPGAAGTLQEVFQDAAQNYYPKIGEPFAPMIFFGHEFWTRMAVLPVLQTLFVGNKKLSQTDFDKFVVIVDTVEQAVEKLLIHNPSPGKTVSKMEALGFGPMLAAVTRARLDPSATA